jgi:hypothetical protein
MAFGARISLILSQYEVFNRFGRFVWQFDRLDHLFREDDFGGDDKSWDECVGLVLLNF